MSDSEETKNVATTLKESDSLAVRALPATVVFGLLAMALAASGHVTIVDLDLYHEMAIFREMLQLGYMPLTDSFAYTPTNHLIVHHEWGTGAAFYLLTVSAGLGAAGLVGAKYLLSLAIVIGCYVNTRRKVPPIFLPPRRSGALHWPGRVSGGVRL